MRRSPRLPSPFQQLPYGRCPRRLRHPRLVAGTFPLLVCPSFLKCHVLYAGGPSSAPDQFFPDDIGLRLDYPGSALRKWYHQRLHVGLYISARQTFRNVVALQVACPPGRSAPQQQRPRTLYIRAFRRFVASSTVEYATRPTGRLPGLVSHQQEGQPFSAAHRNH